MSPAFFILSVLNSADLIPLKLAENRDIVNKFDVKTAIFLLLGHLLHGKVNISGFDAIRIYGGAIYLERTWLSMLSWIRFVCLFDWTLLLLPSISNASMLCVCACACDLWRQNDNRLSPILSGYNRINQFNSLMTVECDWTILSFQINFDIQIRFNSEWYQLETVVLSWFSNKSITMRP